MKYTTFLLLSVSLATTGFAQTDAQKEEAKRVILGGKKETSTPAPKTGDGRTVILGGDRDVYGENRTPNPTTSGTREQRIYEINRAYDAKIFSIRNNRTLSPAEKERIIRQLEADRRRKINAVNGDYNNDNDRDRDNDKEHKKNKKRKGNNGNHYGWQKGKGNPHKNS
jgi:hypothetical protein